MYENQTEAVIKQRMLDRVSNDYDKRVGSLMHDSIAPDALEFEQAYIELDNVVDMFDINNLSGEELEKRVYQRTGITRKPATFASKYIEITGNSNINAGDLFQTESGIQFKVTETKAIYGSGTVNIRAIIAGSDGNVPANTIKYMPLSIPGIISVTNPEPTENGFDSESDEDLLKRYYERLQTPATSGNKAHYKNWAKEVIGIGDAKVIPLWDGNNTVKVIIIDSNRQPASTALINAVQNYIDPGAQGLGDGEAPIGAKCTVESAAPKVITITFTAVKDMSYTDLERQTSIEDNIKDYLKSIAFVESSLSYAKVGSIILNSKEILDYSDLTINDGTANIAIADNEVPVLGVLTIA
jgi:uncharacterized phage protein gp47/JayE